MGALAAANGLRLFPRDFIVASSCFHIESLSCSPTTTKPRHQPIQRLIEISHSERTVTAVDSDKTAKLSFEAALAKLETIVESMEQGEVPLADLLAKYEEGTNLLKVCEGRLKDAELKIEKLKNTKDGAAAFENFESSRAE